ncbi:choloylglycine hydrolase family protein [Lentilactobacillus kisonensis]|uniref:Penicillin amidase n=2 Tax=Lentilactobacillus kisonensis TaxID=481722 RepID=A0A0R1NSE0_9LACO|nr:choloylglycine hydrolase family protein [Lentilactobacillus kisonensis]KRL23025.1 penicillin amidase [Lentilactobacillus kisonensis DSM 19906 = JCM 15041]
MCTSVTFLSKTGDNFLARTMDFGFELKGRPVVMPRDQTLPSDVLDSKYHLKYGFVGAGRNLGHYILVDGVNEKGVSAAALYFSGEAKFADQPKAGKINIAPHEVLNLILGNASSCQELGTLLKQLNIVNAPIQLMGKSVPLHWIVTDRTGESDVLEVTESGIHYMKNPVGVMTNSPDFNWHLKNLSNYTELKPTPHPARNYDGYQVSSFGPGSGALGMPGDYTSVSRFIRTVYMREYTDQMTTDQTVTELSHVLNAVEIPKGVKIKQDGTEDYTQYRGYMDTQNLTYYMQPYTDQTMYQVTLTEELMSKPVPTEFPLADQQQFQKLN